MLLKDISSFMFIFLLYKETIHTTFHSKHDCDYYINIHYNLTKTGNSQNIITRDNYLWPTETPQLDWHMKHLQQHLTKIFFCKSLHEQMIIKQYITWWKRASKKCSKSSKSGYIMDINSTWEQNWPIRESK